MANIPEDRLHQAPRRDFLGWAFYLLHIAILIYILAGWALGALAFYLVFLPAVAVHWQLNKNSCLLNNLESLIRSGRWRDPANPEEGAWLLTVLRRATGVRLTPPQMDVVTYSVLALLWGLGWGRFLGWPVP